MTRTAVSVRLIAGAQVALIDHPRAEPPGLDQMQRDVFGDRRQERRAATDDDRIAEHAQLIDKAGVALDTGERTAEDDLWDRAPDVGERRPELGLAQRRIRLPHQHRVVKPAAEQIAKRQTMIVTTFSIELDTVVGSPSDRTAVAGAASSRKRIAPSAAGLRVHGVASDSDLVRNRALIAVVSQGAFADHYGEKCQQSNRGEHQDFGKGSWHVWGMISDASLKEAWLIAAMRTLKPVRL
jgi:hypothetical protein